MLANVFLDPVKQSMHPDSPVMNSGWEIRAPFFGMVVAIFAICMIVTWLISKGVGPERAHADTPDAEGPAAA